MGIQIDRLSFVNYRQYGMCEINFKKSEKADTQLFAIIAQNGTGKTTEPAACEQLGHREGEGGRTRTGFRVVPLYQ